MVSTVLLKESAAESLSVYSLEDVLGSCAISVFGHPQIQQKAENSFNKLKRSAKQILFFCNEFDKYFNT